jgi:phosphoribosylanthranilate isomerase
MWPVIIEALVARVGVKAARIIGLVVLGVLVFAAVKLGFVFMAWRLDRAQAQRDEARAMVTQLEREAAQFERSATITSDTVDEQEKAISKARGDTEAAMEIVDARIHSNPGGASDRFDPVVLRELRAAEARAAAAKDRLSRPRSE